MTREEFGRRMGEARRAAKMTQAGAAVRLGIAQPRWAEYERGARLPPVVRLIEIVGLLGLSPRILFPEFFEEGR